MIFKDSHLASLDLSKGDNIVLLVGYLRGDIIVTGSKEEENSYLDEHKDSFPLVQEIVNNNVSLNHAQLNELFLILDKNRISKGFFSYFFIDPQKIKDDQNLRKHPGKYTISRDEFRNGVIRFRGCAMLKFGNFRHAYKRLRDSDYQKIEQELWPWMKSTAELLEKFKSRPDKAIDIKEICFTDAWLTGYITGNLLKADTKLIWATFLKIKKSEYESRVSERDLEAADLTQDEIISSAKTLGDEQLNSWGPDIEKLVQDNIRVQRCRREAIDQAVRNLDIYLTWDYMDIYLATSMRSAWEFEDVAVFVDNVFKSKKLDELRLRYFNPSQCYTNHRLNKGLVESLVLKRARVTVYLVQEYDTLGKDSELAATLAQGKPVIAYVPEISENELNQHAARVSSRSLDYFYRRFSQLADPSPGPDALKLLIKEFGDYSKVAAAERKIRENLRIYLSIPRLHTNRADEIRFKQNVDNDFPSICRYIAILDKVDYDVRARLLSEYHPLAMQVNLTDGVANGILVARSYEMCVSLLRGILLNELEFNMQCECCNDDPKNQNESITQLLETLTRCPFRVVTGNRKITNSFWNFYLKNEEANGVQKS